MIRQLTARVEYHWHGWPHLSFKGRDYPGKRVLNGGEPGTLVPCEECSTEGWLVRLDVIPAPSTPSESDLPAKERNDG